MTPSARSFTTPSPIMRLTPLSRTLSPPMPSIFLNFPRNHVAPSFTLSFAFLHRVCLADIHIDFSFGVFLVLPSP